MGFIAAKESFFPCPAEGCDNIVMISAVAYFGNYDGQVTISCGRAGHPDWTVTWPEPEPLAVVTHVSDVDGSEQIEISGHNLQLGGQGDGYCYGHQTFDCLDQLTKAEWVAINQAEAAP